MQSAEKRRRGISLSLTPSKRNSCQQQKAVSSSKVAHVELNQSILKVSEFIRPSPNPTLRTKNTLKPNVVFHYSNESKESQQLESRKLDYQIHHLHRQIVEKRSMVSEIRHRPIERTEKPKPEIKKQAQVQLKLPSTQSLPVKVNPCESYLEKSQFGTEIKNKTKSSPRKTEKRVEVYQQKENRSDIQRRLAQLKWAEDKLLSIIKACDQS